MGVRGYRLDGALLWYCSNKSLLFQGNRVLDGKGFSAASNTYLILHILVCMVSLDLVLARLQCRHQAFILDQVTRRTTCAEVYSLDYNMLLF